MTDLEITRLCAEAMGITGWLTQDDPMVTNANGEFIEPYDPIHDDAQAMALVKKWHIQIYYDGKIHDDGEWATESEYAGIGAIHSDLNRSICLCIADIMRRGNRKELIDFVHSKYGVTK